MSLLGNIGKGFAFLGRVATSALGGGRVTNKQRRQAAPTPPRPTPPAPLRIPQPTPTIQPTLPTPPLERQPIARPENRQYAQLTMTQEERLFALYGYDGAQHENARYQAIDMLTAVRDQRDVDEINIHWDGELARLLVIMGYRDPDARYDVGDTP